MKRIIYLLALVLLAAGIASCGADNAAVTTGDTVVTTEAVTEIVTEPVPTEIATDEFRVLIDNGEATVIEYIGKGSGVGYEVTVPESFDGCPVVAVGDYCFELNISIGSVKLPEGVKTIGRGAFKNCWKLGSIELPASLTEIGVSAFEGCRALKAVEVPMSVTSIGEKAFTADYGINLTVGAASAAEEFAKANGINCIVK